MPLAGGGGEVGKLARTLGQRRVFMVTGSRTLAHGGALAEIAQLLTEAGLEPVEAAAISQEPLVGDVDALVDWLRAQQAGAGDVMLAVGGGSAIDLAKGAGAIVTNSTGESVLDYLEGVGRGLQITRPPLPLLAMPTTGGTGTEATKNAVISSYDPAFKKSLRSDLMVPRVVLVDPELGTSVPPAITAACGMDAITQCVESYISRRAKPIARALAAEGLRALCQRCRWPCASLRIAQRAKRWRSAALLSGMALANSGLGLAHGVAAALGVHAHTSWPGVCADAAGRVAHEPAALRARVGRTSTAGVERALVRRRRGGRLLRRPHGRVVRGRGCAAAAARRGGDARADSGAGDRLARQQPGWQSCAGQRRSIVGPSGAHVVILAAGLSPAWQQILTFEAFARAKSTAPPRHIGAARAKC